MTLINGARTGTLAAAPAQAITPSQRARRERVLDAALELAREGGYDAVQMRAVAERADVALGTLYRYFPSKVHLLASALATHLITIRKRMPPGPELADPGDRVLLMFEQLLRELHEERLLSEALVRAMMFADATASAELQQVHDTTNQLIAEAVHGREHPVSRRDAAVADIIGKVFMADLLGWLGDRMTIDDLRSSLATVVRIALAGQSVIEA